MDEKKKPDLCSTAFSKVTEQMVPVTTSVIMEVKKKHTHKLRWEPVSVSVANGVSRFWMKLRRMDYANRHGKSNSENEFITEFDAIFKSLLEPLGIVLFWI